MARPPLSSETSVVSSSWARSAALKKSINRMSGLGSVVEASAAMRSSTSSLLMQAGSTTTPRQRRFSRNDFVSRLSFTLRSSFLFIMFDVGGWE